MICHILANTIYNHDVVRGNDVQTNAGYEGIALTPHTLTPSAANYASCGGAAEGGSL